PRYGDGLIADFVSNATDLENSQAPIYFQGGNILIGDDFFFIGADYPANTLKYVGGVLTPEPNETPERLVRRLYSEYMDHSRTLHYIGSTVQVPAQLERTITVNGQQWTEKLYYGNHPGTVQPLFHIDMFISLAGKDSAGKNQLLVGDPKMAADALGVPLWPHGMQEVFDNIAKGLARLGFAVKRNPLPLVYMDDPHDRVRLWYFATANNALVSIDGAKKRVWLPSYGFGNWSTLSITDEANRAIWQGLGFQV